MSTPIDHGLCEIEAADLRAEVESLRAERDAAYGQGVNDGQDSMRNENMVQVESLQAQLAAAKAEATNWKRKHALVTEREQFFAYTLLPHVESDLAAVRTDLSVVRRQLSEYEASVQQPGETEAIDER